MYVGMYMCEGSCLQRPEEGTRLPGAEVTGGYEPLDMGTGNYN